MNKPYIHSLLVLVVALLLAGCGGQISDADQVATRVAQDRAVAQTLTAEVAVAAPSTTSQPTVTPGTIPSGTSEAPGSPAPTNTPLPPTFTAAPLQPITPTPTEEQQLLAVFAPGGTANGLQGQVTVIGGAGYDENTRIVPVSGSFGIRIAASDPDFGSRDGDGITRVIYRINSQDTGDTVYDHTENNPPYCLFNDQNDQCTGITLEQGSTWPNGTPLVAGQYFVDVEVQAENSERTEFWNFIVDLQLG